MRVDFFDAPEGTRVASRLARIEQALSPRDALSASVPPAAITAYRDKRMTPPLGLTSWAAFQRAGEQTMVMGDMVLLEDQVNPVMSAALGTILSHRTIMITSVAEASQFLAFGAVEAFLPLYALRVGLDKATVGLLFGAQIGVKTLARPLMGKISDRHGRTRQIVLGLMLTAVTTALFPHTQLAAVLLLLSAIFGLGIAIASAATSAFVADLAPENSRGTALGTMSTIMDMGQAFGPILLGILLLRVSYPMGFAVIAALVIGAGALFAVTATEASPLETPKEE